jgi:hypothetical protein
MIGEDGGQGAPPPPPLLQAPAHRVEGKTRQDETGGRQDDNACLTKYPHLLL